MLDVIKSDNVFEISVFPFSYFCLSFLYVFGFWNLFVFLAFTLVIFLSYVLLICGWRIRRTFFRLSWGLSERFKTKRILNFLGP